MLIINIHTVVVLDEDRSVRVVNTALKFVQVTRVLQFLFDHKAVLEFEKTEGMDLEEIELELIDHGLEEMEESDDKIYVYGDYTNFRKLSEGAESLGITVSKASLQRIPNNPMEFSEEQLEEIEKLIDRVEDDDDVQAVYTNIA